ncbi:MAG: hypothetical protein GOVbin212_40 [Prokaryotic dsDNA virus sp.]|nr:MAG: hypothetical protein GOVbin212_40 [Prokaryotic dsDNA virus sp.]|tara:strand:- start:19074 stop:19646 length:573 start_codon:yes stop_codon:yes gene_type:complete
MKKIKTYLPIFNGFYGSIFEPNEEYEIEYINELRQKKNKPEIDFDDVDFDYHNYYLELSKEFCFIVWNELEDFIYKIEFESLKSPRFYNYSNDYIECKIKPKKQAILNYIKKNYNNWNEYLKDNYTSYDGFISSYDNYAGSEDWSNKNIFNKHQLCAVLSFIAENESITEDALLENEVYLQAKNFDKLTK